MRRKLKTTQVLLIIVVSFFVLSLPAYFRFSNLAGADLPTAALSFENGGQDNLPDHPNELKMAGSNGYSNMFLLRWTFFEQLASVTFEKSSFGPGILTLRC